MNITIEKKTRQSMQEVADIVGKVILPGHFVDQEKQDIPKDGQYQVVQEGGNFFIKLVNA